MLIRTIPSTGEAMPVIGLGTWRAFDAGAGEAARRPLREVLRLLFDAGGRMIDSSPMYGRAEAVTGELLAEMEARTRAFLATKVWTTGRERGIELGAAVAHRGNRPDADPQSGGLAHPSDDVAADEGRGEGALHRDHPLHDRR